MAPPFTLQVLDSTSLPHDLRRRIAALCKAAYGEDLGELLATFGPSTHVLGMLGDRLVSHAMWVTRWLQPGAAAPLETAYVEVVATHPEHQGRGYATNVMRRLAAEIPDVYQLAALCPATPGLYARLGWRFWRGPLSIRMPSGHHLATPEERVMVLELAGRPALNVDHPLSAEWREGEVW
jgi:GNAT superfamily N-acetyltransferase